VSAVGGNFNGGPFSITWTISADNQNITFVMTTSGSPWMAWGVNNRGGSMMVGTDAVVCTVINGAGTVVEYQIYNKTRLGIVPDLIQNVVGSVATAKGVTTCQWTRPLVAANALDQTITLQGFNTFVWAIGQATDNSFLFQHSQRGAVNIDLVNNVAIVAATGLVGLANEFQVQIQNDLVNQKVQITMASLNNGWASVGPSSAGSMATTFGYVCDGNAMKVTAYTITANTFNSMAMVATPNLTQISVTYMNGKLTCVFSRPATATQNGDVSITQTAGKSTQYTWAVGQPGLLALDPTIHANRGAFTAAVGANGVVTITPNATPTDPKVLAHASLMVLAWFFAAPAAVITARYFKHKAFWFAMHRFLNLFVLVSTTVSFIIIYTFQNLNLGGTIPHHAFGVVIIALMFFQAFLGFFKIVIKDIESIWKKVWGQAHQILGHALLFFAFINSLLGQAHIDNPTNRTAFVVVIVVPFIMYLAFGTYMHFKSRNKDEKFDAEFDYMLNAKMNDDRTTMGGKSFVNTDASMGNLFKSTGGDSRQSDKRGSGGNPGTIKKNTPTGMSSTGVGGRTGRFNSEEFDKRFK
jgi:hypothetical protein